MQPNERLKGITACFSKAGLAEGTNAGTIKIVAPNGAGVDFAINGLAYHKADTDNITMTACAAQAVLTTCLYAVWLNSSGDLSVTKGDEVLNTDLAAGTAVLHPPADVADKCMIGMFKIKCENAATFTSGTTDLGAADVTDTYYDVIGGIVRPLTS